jgi:hypothetical protein
MKVGEIAEDNSLADCLWASGPCILKQNDKWVIGSATAPLAPTHKGAFVSMVER